MHQHTGKTSPAKLNSIPAYFSQSDKKLGRLHRNAGSGKMADAAGGTRAEAETLTKADLAALATKIDGPEKELLNKLPDLLKPLAEQMGQLTLALQKVSHVADGAMDLSLSHQEEIRGLKGENERQAEQMAILNNRQRFLI